MTMTAICAKAIEGAADAAGEYLEALGKSDLATLSETEWMGFIQTICTEYDEKYDFLTDMSARVKDAASNPKKWQSPNTDKNGAPTWSQDYGAKYPDLDDEIPF